MYDIAIIGGGPGGYVSAIKASQLGAKVILIEKDAVGGTCLNRGCIPTKTLLCAADKMNELKKLNKFGISATLDEINYTKLIKRKDVNVTKLKKGVENLIKNNNIDFIQGEAKVLDENNLFVNEEKISFKNLVIATGSTPADLPQLKADGEFILNSNHILELNQLPESILIVGAGAIGVEWARIFSALKVKTTILELSPRLLPAGSEEVSSYIEKSFKLNKVKTYTGTAIEKIDDKKVYLDNSEVLEPERILLATGRKACLPKFENIQIEMNNNFIKVNNNLQTNIKNIYAIGDVNGHMQLAHVASYQGICAVENIIKGKNVAINYNHIPFIVYGKPEIASVGAKEGDKTFTLPMSILGKSIADDEQEGFIKVISKNNIIIGADIVAKEASSLISTLALAIKEEIPINKLKEFVFAHPTYSEGIHEAILGLSNEAIHL